MLLTIFFTAACMSLGRLAFWEGSFLFLKSFLPRTRLFSFLAKLWGPVHCLGYSASVSERAQAPRNAGELLTRPFVPQDCHTSFKAMWCSTLY